MADTQTQNTPETQQVTVDELRNKIRETTDELNTLKNWLNNLSAEELQQKASELSDIEHTISECMEDLSNLEKDWSASISRDQLDGLRSQINTLTTSKDVVQAQIETQTRAKLDSLKWNIAQSQNNWESQEWDGQQWEKKWLSGWWNWLNKWQKWGVRIWWALAWLWILKLGKRIFGEKYDYEKEIPWYKDMSRREKRAARKRLKKEKRAARRSERSAEKWEFRQRPFWKFVKWVGIFAWVWSGIYYLAHWIYTKNWWLKDLFDWERWKKLTFDQAIDAAKWSMANYGDWTMAYGMDLKYHEDTSEIEAYWERIKISTEKNWRIEWLNVEFKKYEHMISTAILIAYLKKNYSWKCKNNTPFSWSGWWRWNMDVGMQWWSETAVDGSWNWWRIVWISAWAILWIVAWIYWWLWAWAAVLGVWAWWWYIIWRNYDTDNVLHNYMPELDGESWIKIFSGYLNNLGCREAWNQDTENLPDSPLKAELKECIDDLQTIDDDNELRWRIRNLTVEPDPTNEKKCTIKAYRVSIQAEIIGDWSNKKVKFLWVSGWNPEIKSDLSKWNFDNRALPAKEALYMASLIWSMVNDYHGKSNRTPHIEYKHRGWMWWPWLYINDSWWNDTRILKESLFKDRMPTLYQDRQNFTAFLNDWIKSKSTNASYWRE